MRLPYADDVKSEQAELQASLHVIIRDKEIEAEGVLEFEDGEGRARLLPRTGRCRDGPEKES